VEDFAKFYRKHYQYCDKEQLHNTKKGSAERVRMDYQPIFISLAAANVVHVRAVVKKAKRY